MDYKEVASLKMKRLTDLRYLEDTIDMEQGLNRGAMANKKMLVYAPPKTGTLSLEFMIGSYLAAHDPSFDRTTHILHNHDNGNLINHLKIPAYLEPNDLRQNLVVRDLIKYKEASQGHIRIVSSFRDPLRRAMSDLFHNIQYAFIEKEQHGINAIRFDECRDRLLKILAYYENLPHSLEEIDDDFFSKYRFDKQAKCCYINRGHYEVVAVTLEHSAIWPEILEGTFNFKDIRPLHIHRTADKILGQKYQEFKQQLELPANLIYRIYFGGRHQQNILRWFYTPTEIKALYQHALKYYGPKSAARSDGQ